MNQNIQISLRAARVNAGLSQKVAAEQLRIGTSTLQGYENGRSIPRWDIIRRMQDIYGMDSRHFLIPENPFW